MALIKSITLESGLVLNQAYIRVQGVNGNKEIASISLEVFVSEQTCLDGKRPLDFMQYTFTPAEEEFSPRWDKQAYEYLKTLPEFAGAMDA